MSESYFNMTVNKGGKTMKIEARGFQFGSIACYERCRPFIESMAGGGDIKVNWKTGAGGDVEVETTEKIRIGN